MGDPLSLVARTIERDERQAADEEDRRARLRGLAIAQETGARPSKAYRNGRQWARNRTYFAALRSLSAERREAGDCPRCGEAAESGRVHCAGCRRRNADRTRALKQARRDAGQCPRCGGDPDPGLLHCGRCLDRQRAERQRAKARQARPGDTD